MEIASLDEFEKVPVRPIWRHVARFMDLDDLAEMCFHVVPELRGLDKLIHAERKSNVFKAEIKYARECPNPNGVLEPSCTVDVGDEEDELWYSWEASDAGFHSVDNFITFCHKAGVQPDAVVLWSDGLNPKRYYWVSSDKKLAFSLRVDPRHFSGHAFDMKVTGLRSRSRGLLVWYFHKGEGKPYCCPVI